MIEDFLFPGAWEAIPGTAMVAVVAYLTLLVFVRLSGKRTLARMNAFDFIVTVALGSMLATTIVSREVNWAQGAVGLGLLIILQFLLTWTTVRSQKIRQFVTGEPALLLYEGEPLPSVMKRERVAMDELHAAIRAAGLTNLQSARAVVLETDGKFSVLSGEPGEPADSGSTLQRVPSPRQS